MEWLGWILGRLTNYLIIAGIVWFFARLAIKSVLKSANKDCRDSAERTGR